MIKPTELIAKFQYALDNKWGYIYGKTYELWTEAKQKAVENDPNGREQTKQYGRKWIGHYVTDCSGLFYWAFKELGGYMYHGSNTMWNKYSTAKGKLINGKRSDGKELKPGSAVYMNKTGTDRSHVGLYIGNGEVIEAKGTAYGVVKSKVNAWDEWSELVGVDYEEQKEDVVIVAKQAVVIGGDLNIRSAKSTTAKRIGGIPNGTTIEVMSDDGTWASINYKNMTGFVMSKYLKYEEYDGTTIVVERAKLESAYNILGDLLQKG